MAVSGPSRRHGWILRVRVIMKSGLDFFGDLPGTYFGHLALKVGRLYYYYGSFCCKWGRVLHVGGLLLSVGSFCCTRVLVLYS